MKKIKAILSLMRVQHYIKNLILIIPALYAKRLLDIQTDLRLLLGIIAFSFISSAVYVLNDIKDLPRDRIHPKKRNRPLPSGKISVPEAYVILIVCIFLAIFPHAICRDWKSICYLAIYLAINCLYSYGLKNVPIIDVVILSSGYVLRILYGGAIADVAISSWLFLTVMAGSLFMGLGKRRNEKEIQTEHRQTRKVLDTYTYSFLDKNMYVLLALTDAFYALWAIGQNNSLFLWTIPIFMIILMRYSLCIEDDSSGDPVEVLLHDRFIVVVTILYCGITTMALYWK